MQKNFARGLALLLLVVVGVNPLFSASLENIVKNSLEASSQMQSYQLLKQNTALTVSIDDTEDELGIEVKSGNVYATYDTTNNGYEFGTSDSSVTFTLPNDEETTITVGTGSTSLFPSLSGYAISPYVSVGHTLTYGETGDNRSALLSKETLLLGDHTYDTNVLGFKTSLYQQIISLLATEKSINETKKEIEDTQTEIDNELKLRTMDENSLSYQGKRNTLESLENSLSSQEANAALIRQQYKTLTGLNWDGVTDIPLASLSFTVNPKGNTFVSLKAIALDIAKEDLKVEQARLTNRTLGLSGTISSSSTNETYSSSTITTGSTTTDLSGSLNALYTGKTFSFGGSVAGTYAFDTGDFSPTLTVSGSWNNDNTSTVDKLNLQKLQNKVLLAQIEYNDALNTYLYDATSLSGDIAAWKLSHSLQTNTEAYHQRELTQQKALFEKGLARESEVAEAAFTIAQDVYDRNIDLLEGLVLQNQIDSLLL
jgi:hypothetical protein